MLIEETWASREQSNREKLDRLERDLKTEKSRFRNY